ncbi:MAG: TIGR02281 family clan AA aspartic protease [Gammaproteobacteria bacterium]|nr:TIGR02281 family clan AA aspartic protease [Gammaproteobacteria bacterium]MDH5630420.1 TIGR02281 family clan AA aspartic protease [Gammaproteobacteria bacterium]
MNQQDNNHKNTDQNNIDNINSFDNQDPDNQYDPARSTGNTMMIIAWIIALVLMTSLFGILEEKQNNPNQQPASYKDSAYSEVILVRNRYGHYVTSGEINNIESVFMIDTGATYVAIPGELEKKLGLQRGQSFYSHTANGTSRSYETTIKKLAIGDIVLHNVEASIAPNMEGDEILLGMSVLNQLEYHQKGNQLTLRQTH